jgi:nicotinate-nucleotide adenylyltransferase
MAAGRKKTGLFGGTFNPVHNAHLRMAEEVKSEFGLDRILFIPSAFPPHKGDRELVAAPERCEMLAKAIAPNPGFAFSDVEIRREGRSYTADTVSEFTENASGEEAHFLIIGLDAFFEIETWKDFGSLFEMIPFIVLKRPIQSYASPAGDTISSMSDHARRHVDPSYKVDESRGCLVHPRMMPVHLYEATQLDISSTRIRALTRQRRSIRYLVPDAVFDHIVSKELYADGA